MLSTHGHLKRTPAIGRHNTQSQPSACVYRVYLTVDYEL